MTSSSNIIDCVLLYPEDKTPISYTWKMIHKSMRFFFKQLTKELLINQKLQQTNHFSLEFVEWHKIAGKMPV